MDMEGMKRNLDYVISKCLKISLLPPFHSLALCHRSHPQFKKECSIPSHTHFLLKSCHNNFALTQFCFKTFFLPLLFSFIFSHSIPFSQTKHNTSIEKLLGTWASLAWWSAYLILACSSNYFKVNSSNKNLKVFRKRLQQDHMLQQTLFNNYHTGLTKAQLPILSSLWRLLVLATDRLIVNMEIWFQSPI